MWDMNDVIKIEYKGGFVYHVVFDDGKRGDMDFSEYVRRGGDFRTSARHDILQEGNDRGRHYLMAKRR